MRLLKLQLQAWLLKPWSVSDFLIWVVVLVCGLIFFRPAPAMAQGAGVLDPSRIPGSNGWISAGAGAIPARTTICATPSLSAGSGNAAANGAAIRSAIAGCTAGQTVGITAGIWYVDYVQFGSPGNPINNVTLRGAGANSTFIIFTVGTNCIGIGPTGVCLVNSDNNYGGNPSNAATWTSGYTKGTTSITLGTFSVGSLSNLHVGSLLILDQLDDPSDTGNVYICQSVGNPGCSQQGGVGNGRPGRAQNQTVTVTNISGSTITFTPGLYAGNWDPAKSPGAWFSSGLPITGDGVENMSLDYSFPTGCSPGSACGNGVMITNGSGNWVTNVRGINSVSSVARSAHVQMNQSVHNTIRSNYFYGSLGQSSSYGVDSAGSSGDNLIENNIFQHISTAMITEGDTGSVFAYNYAVDDFYTNPPQQQQDTYHHSVGDMFTLREGNEAIGFATDTIHGSSALITAFRNFWNGRDPAITSGQAKTQATNPMSIYAFSRETNIIGNVLGTSGYHTNYQLSASSATDNGNAGTGNASIYLIGYSGTMTFGCGYFSTGCSGNGTSILDDLTTGTTLYRWGNYDVVSGAPRFVSGEVPSGISPYAQPVPMSHTLPNSLYLPSAGASKPPFVPSSSPWPLVGPDVTGGNIGGVGGFANHNPAANCYLNVMGGLTNGSSGALNFDPSTCYSGGGGGTPSIAFSPTSYGFGSVLVSAMPPACPTNCVTITMSNPGTAPLTWTGPITVSDTTDYTITSIGGCVSPLAAGGSCMPVIQFNPMSVGSFPATLNVNGTNIGGMSYTVPFTGSGIMTGPTTPPSAPILIGQLP